MWQSVLVVSYLVISIRISIIDIKTHLIQNLDLILLLFATCFLYPVSLFYAGVNFFLYLFIYFLIRMQLGLGVVKLAFVIGIAFTSIYGILWALNFSWLLGGCWALISGQKKVAFAPWMLLGAFLAQTLVIQS